MHEHTVEGLYLGKAMSNHNKTSICTSDDIIKIKSELNTTSEHVN